MEKIKKILNTIWNIVKQVWDILRYPVQFVLYLMNTTSWFTKTSEGKVVKIETFYILMIIASAMGAYAVGSDSSKGLEFSSFYSWMVLPFCSLAVLRVLTSLFLGVVPKSIQDHFWRTQLINFTDPKFYFQRELYPNFENKLVELKDKWVQYYGETIATTKANAPWQQSPYFQVGIIIVTSLIALALGYWL